MMMMNKVFYLKFCNGVCSVTRLVNSRIGSVVIVTSLRTERCQASGAANGYRPCVHSGSGTQTDCSPIHTGFLFPTVQRLGRTNRPTPNTAEVKNVCIFNCLFVCLSVYLSICLSLTTLSVSQNVYSAEVESLANDKICRKRS